ncbi:hypothetical protein GO491_02995 [Flavobacteriaceae bacterium Ap0902]|nr:hypothetical protein [Flavobacteriaceae bacterium Ap0902]
MKTIIEIPFSRKSKYKVFVFIFIAFLGGLFMVLYPSKLSGSFIFRNELILLICGYFVIVGSLLLLVQYLYLFYFFKHGLIVTNEGFFNYTGLFYNGVIKWDDIKSLSIDEKYKNTINVKIKNPKYYIKRTENPIRKLNVYMYYYFYSTPCVIGVQILDIETTELIKLLQDNFKKYG